jgi:hypothetical protein
MTTWRAAPTMDRTGPTCSGSSPTTRSSGDCGASISGVRRLCRRFAFRAGGALRALPQRWQSHRTPNGAAGISCPPGFCRFAVGGQEVAAAPWRAEDGHGREKKMAPGSFATRGRSQRVDSRKGAFAPNFSSWQPIALPRPASAHSVAMKRLCRCRRPDGLSRHRDRLLHVDIRDRASVQHPSSRWSVAPPRPGLGTLISATGRSFRFRCLDGPSPHLGRPLHVDIRDRAFVPQPLPREPIASFSATSTR